MQDAYYFGKLARRINIFAYPRTGSHLFSYAMSGLFDLVALDHGELHNAEAIDRQRELREEVLYALALREENVPYAPVVLDATSRGVHGRPTQDSALPMIVLIREPLAAAYSIYRVNRDRWKTLSALKPAWIEQTLRDYASFYEGAIPLAGRASTPTLLVRYEELVRSPRCMEEIVEFVGIRPKLQPAFVHWLLEFSRMARPGERTFYRGGTNSAWRDDPEWIGALRQVPEMDFARFGYPALSAALAVGSASL